LIDCTDDVNKKMHSILAPTVPRVGEFVTPQNGSRMVVIGVEYLVAQQGKGENVRDNFLIPHVMLEVADED
ncbi:MAG: hypothetical protein KDA87_24180, partial [Planctomycetales bacterium]|nr:hypothetical protein [Planctomycetales bacterium]